METGFGISFAPYRTLVFRLACIAGFSLAPLTAQAAHLTLFTVDGCDSVFNVKINDNGMVAGTCLSDSALYGFLGTPGGKIERFSVGKPGMTRAEGLNSKGQIAGSYPDKRNPNWEQGFVRSAEGKLTRLRGKGRQTAVIPGGINDAGATAGTYYNGKDRSVHGFLRDADGVLTVFDAPGQANSTTVFALNNQDTVAGFFIGSSGHEEGFLRSADGSFTTFQVPKFTDSEAVAINSKDVATGRAINDANDQLGFIRTPDGTITTFRAGKGVTAVTPVAINDSGIVVGTFENVKKDVTHSFVRFANGKIKTIDVPNAALTMVTSINSKGVVAGYYYTASGGGGGFMGRP